MLDFISIGTDAFRVKDLDKYSDWCLKNKGLTSDMCHHVVHEQ